MAKCLACILSEYINLVILDFKYISIPLLKFNMRAFLHMPIIKPPFIEMNISYSRWLKLNMLSGSAHNTGG